MRDAPHGRERRDRHPDDEALLEIALQPGTRLAGEAHLRACSSCSRRLARLRSDTARMRGLLQERAAALSTGGSAAQRFDRVADLRARVLAATTRQDPGWRGDLELVCRFLRGRMRASAWVRVAAASLFVHLAALPVMAWVLLHRPPERSFSTAVLPPPPPSPAESSEPRWDPVPEDFNAAPGPDAAAGRLRELEAQRWARWQLGQDGLPGSDEPPRSEVGRLLAARTANLAASPRGPLPSAPATSTLGRVLQLEIALDRFVIVGEQLQGLDDLARLGLAPVVQEPGLRCLIVAALHRAAAYGLLAEHWVDELRAFERSASGDSTPAVLEDPLRADAPVDATWIALLDAALPTEARDDPVVRAWLRWRR